MGSCNCADRERHDWFKMSPGTFFASDTVVDSEPWEIQCFLHMLMLSWQGPGLPADRKRLAKRLGLTTERLGELLGGAVGEKWSECCGKLWNEKQEELRDEAQARRESYKDRGKKGGEASGKARSKPKLQPSYSEAPASPSLATAKQQLSNSQAAAKLSEPEEKRREETTLLPSGASGGRALTPHDGSPVPQKNLETAIAKCLEPLPHPVLVELREFAVHVGERTGQSRGESYWRGIIEQLWKRPERALDRLAFSRGKDGKNLLDPTDDELAKFRGEDGKGRDQFVTARVAVQRANTASLDALVAKSQQARSQGPSAFVLPENPTPFDILGMPHLNPPCANAQIEESA